MWCALFENYVLLLLSERFWHFDQLLLAVPWFIISQHNGTRKSLKGLCFMQIGTRGWNFAICSSLWLFVHSNCNDYISLNQVLLWMHDANYGLFILLFSIFCFPSNRGGQHYRESLLHLMILMLMTGFLALLSCKGPACSSTCFPQVSNHLIILLFLVPTQFVSLTLGNSLSLCGNKK